ncbi:MAG: HesA/MoeB/ThiF family protein [Methanobacteriota archaeon]
MSELADYDKKRYHRQTLIPGLGESGQKKLKNSKVFIAGAGGLGSPAAIYSAVAGIGNIKIVDRDVVELSNLNRQILHWDKNIGQAKVESASEKLIQINPHINVEVFKETIDESNVLELTRDSDLIIDATDNFPTRYLLNGAAIVHRIPLIHAAVYGLEGRITAIVPGKTPCLRCIFAAAPPPEVFPILGATAGVVALLEVTEALKILLGIGKPLLNRLLIYDGEQMKFEEIAIKRNPDCKTCGKNGTHSKYLR